MTTKTKPPLASRPANLDPSLAREITVVKKATTDLPVKIRDAAEYTRVAASHKVVHALIASIESWYDAKIKPIAKVVTDLRAEKKHVLDEPLAWEDAAERLISAWYVKKEEDAARARLALQNKLDAEAAAARKREVSALKREGDKSAAVALAAAPIVAAVAEVENEASLDGRSFREDVEVTLVDIDVVPVEYVKRELRLSEIKAAWKQGVRDIPGLALKPVKTLVNRGA